MELAISADPPGTPSPQWPQWPQGFLGGSSRYGRSGGSNALDARGAEMLQVVLENAEGFMGDLGCGPGHAPLHVSSSPSVVWIAELFAILVTVVLVLFATQLQISHYLAVRKKQTNKALRMAYPWKSLPSAGEIMELGPTFATNFQSGLKQSFLARGMSAATEKVALVSFLIPAEAPGVELLP